MKLVVISGRSGSGKSAALHLLEDLGFFSIDNLPVGLLSPLVEQALQQQDTQHARIAASIDARNLPQDLHRFPDILRHLRHRAIDCEVLYLDASEKVLFERFSATRRKHPLTRQDSLSLAEAIAYEQHLLEPIANLADLRLDTTDLSVHQLRDLICQRVEGKAGHPMSILVESFGFKHGVPLDADLVFDARCLPNPYWETSLRDLTGLDAPVQAFLAKADEVQQMQTDIYQLLSHWLPRYQASNRSYMTIAVGCTGGQHRSVYLCEALVKALRIDYPQVQIRHRELKSP